MKQTFDWLIKKLLSDQRTYMNISTNPTNVVSEAYKDECKKHAEEIEEAIKVLSQIE